MGEVMRERLQSATGRLANQAKICGRISAALDDLEEQIEAIRAERDISVAGNNAKIEALQRRRETVQQRLEQADTELAQYREELDRLIIAMEGSSSA